MEFYGRLQVGYFHKWEEKFAQFVLNSWKDASPRLFRINPKGKSSIDTLQRKTFAKSVNLECQPHFKIYHRPLLELCTFHAYLAFDDSPKKYLME